MVSSMVSAIFASFAILAALPNAQADAPRGFKISTCAKPPGGDFGAPFPPFWLGPWYTYTNVNDIVGYPYEANGTVFKLSQEGSILDPRSGNLYKMHLNDTRPRQKFKGHKKLLTTAPAGYLSIDLNYRGGGKTPGFYFISVRGNPYLNKIGFRPIDPKSVDFQIFTICHVAKVMNSKGAKYQFLYRTKESSPYPDECNDVTLYAHFKNASTGEYDDTDPC